MTSIGGGAFWECSGLTSVYISDIAAWCKIAFGNYYSNPLSYAHHLYLGEEEISDLVIPNSVTSIGNYTFYSCSSLTSVAIPNSVTTIGNSTFYGCNSLASVKMSNSVTTIGENAFCGCSLLQEFKLPDSLRIIRKVAFKGCSSLKTVTIPSSVEFIYQEAFANCTGLESVRALPEAPPFLYNNSFSNYNIPLYVPEAAITAYQAHDAWSKFAQFLTLNGQEVEIPQCAMPTVAYADGQLTLDCETEGAECMWTLRNPDTLSGRGKTIPLACQYELTVYAIAKGMTDSDQVTYLIVWGDNDVEGDNIIRIGAGGEDCDVNHDGIVDVADIATIIDRMAGK